MDTSTAIHLIKRCNFTFRPYSVECECGALFESLSQPCLASAYAEHQARLTGAERAANARAGIRRSRIGPAKWGVS
jgi:hypothetical protein